MNRPYDLVLFGATGFTGALVAQALAHSDEVKGGLRWALAGRNREKLQGVADRLPGTKPPVIVVDASDAAGLAAMAKDTRAVVTTVGPYLRHGLPLAAACAAAGTHYADLTGEPPFIRKNIDDNHVRAQQSGARIVHCCGFDSIPSDLGTLVLQEAAIAAGGPCDDVTFTLMAARGGLSGGTAHSLLAVAEAAAADPKARRAMGDPYSLVPDGPRGKDKDNLTVRFDDDVNGFVAPFFMGAINSRVVRRSAHLLGRYGAGFSYREQHRTGRGLRGRLAAEALRAGLAAVFGGASTRVGRAVFERVFPAAGTGPNEAAREGGFFTAHIHGRRTSDRAHFRAVVKGHKDPGYAGTAIMLSQSALCLAVDSLPSAGGVTTPAAAMGLVLVERLKKQGMELSADRVV